DKAKSTGERNLDSDETNINNQNGKDLLPFDDFIQYLDRQIDQYKRYFDIMEISNNESSDENIFIKGFDFSQAIYCVEKHVFNGEKVNELTCRHFYGLLQIVKLLENIFNNTDILILEIKWNLTEHKNARCREGQIVAECKLSICHKKLNEIYFLIKAIKHIVKTQFENSNFIPSGQYEWSFGPSKNLFVEYEKLINDADFRKFHTRSASDDKLVANKKPNEKRDVDEMQCWNNAVLKEIREQVFQKTKEEVAPEIEILNKQRQEQFETQVNLEKVQVRKALDQYNEFKIEGDLYQNNVTDFHWLLNEICANDNDKEYETEVTDAYSLNTILCNNLNELTRINDNLELKMKELEAMPVPKNPSKKFKEQLEKMVADSNTLVNLVNETKKEVKDKEMKMEAVRKDLENKFESLKQKNLARRTSQNPVNQRKDDQEPIINKDDQEPIINKDDQEIILTDNSNDVNDSEEESGKNNKEGNKDEKDPPSTPKKAFYKTPAFILIGCMAICLCIAAGIYIFIFMGKRTPDSSV
ncbi:hypothetical protein ENBRE01_3226, partial [Enteropsectra breve]